jgi:type 1 glutamine amidotransferase
MKRLLAVLVLIAAALVAPISTWVAAQQTAPLRIFLRGGPKTHGPAGNGLHDHEVWVKEWTPLLASRGARVDGGLQFPTAAQLEATDVLVMFAANAGTILAGQRSNLETFLKRGGGIVVIHDALVAGQDPHWFKTIVGGAWENTVAKYFEGENTFYYVNTEHPIVKEASNFTITDEVYWDLHMMPRTQVLAASMQPVRPGRGETAAVPPAIGRLIPQVWVYENQLEGGQPYRAFVHLLGHHFTTFSSRHFRGVVLRGIAWAGKRDADSLATPEELSAVR